MHLGHCTFEQPSAEAKAERGRIKGDSLFQVVNIDIDHYLQSRRFLL
jgi:hypothetical protein